MFAQVNNLAHYVLTLRLLSLMKKTAESSPPTSVRIVMQSSEMHRMAPNDVQFTSKDEINQERDGTLLFVTCLFPWHFWLVHLTLNLIVTAERS